jgi:SAM-dependent methyltransferase
MHDTAMEFGKQFFTHYTKNLQNGIIIDIGSQDVNGSLREIAPLENNTYIGIDFASGKGVDIILEDPYAFPIKDNTADIVVSSSCLEHSEFFWLTFSEMARITKPGGFLYINVPSNLIYHAYPVDCWRFYKDAGAALAKWATRCGHPLTLLESLIGPSGQDDSNDYVAVYQKNS